MRLKNILVLLLGTIAIYTDAQERVDFQTDDKVQVIADYYKTEKGDSSQWAIMFHQADYSRGEYKEMAARMMKMGFNCLAVDLRIGKEANFVINETATIARERGYPQVMLDCEKDMLAAIKWVRSVAPAAKINLVGSSFSGSLCLKIAAERNDINSVIVFSPGEFFEPKLSIKNTLTDLKTPVYVGCTRSEYEYAKNLLSQAKPNKKVIFRPEKGEGLHGSKTLWWDSPTRNEYWLSLLFFLNNLK